MTEDARPKKRGRPPSAEEGRRRFNLTFRIRGDLKDQIAARAEQSGRSISEEMEFIIEDYNYKLHVIKLKDDQISRITLNSERFEAAYREMCDRIYEIDRIKSTSVRGMASIIENIFSKAINDAQKVSAEEVNRIKFALEFLKNVFRAHDLSTHPEGVLRKGFREQAIVNLATIHRPETVYDFFRKLIAHAEKSTSPKEALKRWPKRFENLPDKLKEDIMTNFGKDHEELYELFLISAVLHHGIDTDAIN